MEISPRSPVPKHQQLREILINLIDTELEPDTPIPSERDLGERYGLSRMTVRQAINQLVADGRLYRVRGRGTFVAQPKMDLQIRLASFTEDMTRRGINPGEPVVRLARLRYADSIPMAVERTHLPENRVPGLLSRGTPHSLYQVLADEYGLKLTWGEQVIEAGNPDPEDAALLEIPAGGVVLRMSRRSYAGDVLIEYAVSAYRADRYQLWVPLERPAQPITNPRAARPAGDVGATTRG
jgi:GntR family transcriptional regulator